MICNLDISFVLGGGKEETLKFHLNEYCYVTTEISPLLRVSTRRYRAVYCVKVFAWRVVINNWLVKNIHPIHCNILLWETGVKTRLVFDKNRTI